MRILPISAALLAVGLPLAAASWATDNQPGSPPTELTPAPVDELQTTLSDIKTTLGFVPEFLKETPDSILPGAWQEMKGLEMNPQTVLSGQLKELISLAVAAQIPCAYCTYFHREAALAQGATKDEVKEALFVAAVNLNASTLEAGSLQEDAAFDAEIQQIVASLKARANSASTDAIPAPGAPATPVTPAPAPLITDAASAKADIQTQLGILPSLFKNIPDAALVGFWKELKAVLFTPGLLGLKSKSLIALASAAQLGDKHGIHFHTEVARGVHNASEQEIQEALAMAGITRHWSTILNGLGLNETTFRADADRIMQKIRSNISNPPAPSPAPTPPTAPTPGSGSSGPTSPSAMRSELRNFAHA